MFPFPCFLDDFPNCQYFRESVVRQNGWDHLGSFWNSPKCWAPSPPNPDLIGLVCSLGIWIFKSSQVILMCSQGWQPECPSCVTDGIFPRSVSPRPLFSLVFCKSSSHLKAWFWASRIMEGPSGPVWFRWFHFMLRLIKYESKENTQDHCQLPCRSDCSGVPLALPSLLAHVCIKQHFCWQGLLSSRDIP